MALTVVIIDGHPEVGRGLRSLLGTMPEVEVCGVSVDGEDGLTRAAAVRPNVVLVDAELPGQAGRALIGRLRVCLPATRVVALGLYPRWRATALAAGAHSFLFKDAGYEALHAAITGDGAIRGPIAKENPR